VILLAFEDITALTGALAQQALLLRELHHRVKNNLQLVSSLSGLQSDHFQDPAVQHAFEEHQRRIQAMAMVHEQLSQLPELSRIDH
jgi:two-component sensor histidine kinase